MNVSLIISPMLEARTEKIRQILVENKIDSNHPDLLFFDDDAKLGVEQAKKIREHLSFKPNKAVGRAVAVVSAQNFSPDAQNALLKTLEEPPAQAVILLGAEKESDLLATVVSRCEISYIQKTQKDSEKSESSEKSEFGVAKLLEMSVEERFLVVEKAADKDQLLKELIQYASATIKKDPKSHKLAKGILQAEEWSKSNVNVRAILEYLMLSLPKVE